MGRGHFAVRARTRGLWKFSTPDCIAYFGKVRRRCFRLAAAVTRRSRAYRAAAAISTGIRPPEIASARARADRSAAKRADSLPRRAQEKQTSRAGASLADRRSGAQAVRTVAARSSSCSAQARSLQVHRRASSAGATLARIAGEEVQPSRPGYQQEAAQLFAVPRALPVDAPAASRRPNG